MKNRGIWKKGILIVLVASLLLIPQQLLASRPKVEAAAAVLIDAQTGKVLWQAQGDRVVPAPGIAQLMSEWLVLDAVRGGHVAWEDSVRVGNTEKIQQASMSPYQTSESLSLRADDQIPLNELFMGLAVSSSSEAEKVLARYTGGSEKSFTWMMNEKARRIGLSPSAVFKPSETETKPSSNSSKSVHKGVASGSAMTAKDAAILCRSLIEEHPEILRMSSVTQTEISSRGIYMTNTNAMLPEFAGPHAYYGMDGLKAYGSKQQGYSLAGTVQRDGRRMIVVILGADSREKSFRDAGRLLDYGYAQSGSFVQKATSWLKLV
ncbi:D-alanyl-D-alanine carboxypeptidase family protein [Saccharibacillus sp. JS10]|uniref:D-alanyl-D-alanine carboxypeptidase family protein n=1 Tax=Saccharibacillus sp. JS10 TaxID=2950552 RepID=UPI00210D8AD8|nr:hypothetical protein [Saccharibacillus sp. JS10]MCQ4087776.1 hypothetical protein [Saccharibacillus sp. JS10]